jgi:Spy/CpxP family protein refolding chaperone
MTIPTRRYRPTLAFAIATLLASLPAAYAAEDSTPAPETRKERIKEGADRMADKLGLTDDQRAKIKALNQQEKAELDTLRADKALAKEDRHAKAEAVRAKYREQRQALMTPEQRAKADKMHERMKERRERHGDRDEKPGDK